MRTISELDRYDVVDFADGSKVIVIARVNYDGKEFLFVNELLPDESNLTDKYKIMELHLEDGTLERVNDPELLMKLSPIMQERIHSYANDEIDDSKIKTTVDDAKAHFDIYLNYVNDNTFDMNVNKAMSHLRIAAEQGYPNAQYVLGNRLLSMDKNIDEGRRWLEIAFDNGFVEAVFSLYDSYYRGRWQISATEMVEHPIDKTRAIRFLERAADMYECDGKNVPIIYYYLHEHYYDELGNDSSLDNRKFVLESALYYCRKAKNAVLMSSESQWIFEEIDSRENSLNNLLELYSNSSNRNSNSSNKTTGPCYIATAVYGSYDCPEVWTLRRFRDEVLYRTSLGKTFIKTYYRISPGLVKKYGDCKPLKNIAKVILDNFVKKLNDKGINDSYYVDK